MERLRRQRRPLRLGRLVQICLPAAQLLGELTALPRQLLVLRNRRTLTRGQVSVSGLGRSSSVLGSLDGVGAAVQDEGAAPRAFMVARGGRKALRMPKARGVSTGWRVQRTRWPS